MMHLTPTLFISEPHLHSCFQSLFKHFKYYYANDVFSSFPDNVFLGNTTSQAIVWGLSGDINDEISQVLVHKILLVLMKLVIKMMT